MKEKPTLTLVASEPGAPAPKLLRDVDDVFLRARIALEASSMPADDYTRILIGEVVEEGETWRKLALAAADRETSAAAKMLAAAAQIEANTAIGKQQTELMLQLSSWIEVAKRLLSPVQVRLIHQTVDRRSSLPRPTEGGIPR
jgi:hypothetical protein